MVQQELRDAQDREERHYNRGRITIRYNPGDQVDLFREGIVIDTDARKPLKLTEKWIGPFPVFGPGPHPDTNEFGLSGSVIGDIWPISWLNGSNESRYHRVVLTLQNCAGVGGKVGERQGIARKTRGEGFMTGQNKFTPANMPDINAQEWRKHPHFDVEYSIKGNSSMSRRPDCGPLRH
ncbi:hypothetical protein HDU86_000135 [Geranomyces michiganensis]|nr:hypothetical protein HDU86_000135 [Geranomyces michiganensis]